MKIEYGDGTITHIAESSIVAVNAGKLDESWHVIIYTEGGHRFVTEACNSEAEAKKAAQAIMDRRE